jgi:hypothetical protein
MKGLGGRGVVRTLRGLFSCCGALCLTAGLAFGQATVGSIVGNITDTAGETVPSVEITVTNLGTGALRHTAADTQGAYSVTNLEPGNYQVSARASGFQQTDHTGIVLNAQVTARIDITLRIGSSVSAVTVFAGAPVINSDTATIASTISNRELIDNSVNLQSVAGVTGDSGVFNMINLLPSGYQSSGARWSMYGSRGSQAYFNVDGISINSAGYGNYLGDAQPAFDSIQEIHYNMVQNAAEYPQLVNITTVSRSGTNNFHGTLFEYNSNSTLNALSYFATSASARNASNQFGGSLAGPVLRNKIFFMTTYQGARQNVPAVLNSSVPSTNYRAGNFGSTKIKNPYTGAYFANNTIPSNLLSSSALAWQAYIYPLANFGAPGSNYQNLRGTYRQNNQNDQFDVRGDYTVSPSNSFYVRYSYNRSFPTYLEGSLPPDVLGYEYYLKTSHQGVLSDTWILSPRFLNVAKIGYTRATIVHYGSTPGQSVIDQLGIQGLPQQPANAWGIPAISISGFTSPTEVANSSNPDQTIQLSDQMTWQKGKHTLKWGVDYRPQYFGFTVNPTFGSYSFTGAFSGSAYADFLLGLPVSTSYVYPRRSEYSNLFFINSFIQDDFTVSPRLTLSYGIRYDYNSPSVDKYDTVANFNPATGAIVVPDLQVFRENVNPNFPSQIPVQTAAEAGFPERSLRVGWHNGFGPRFGFALRPFANSRTAIRGGYGFFNDDLDADMFRPMYGGPFGLATGYTGKVTNGNPNITLTHPFANAGGTVGAVSITGLDKNLRNPYIQQWSLTVEQDLGWQTGLRLSYVGTKSTQLIYERDLNQVPASTTAFSQKRTPYPLWQHTYMYQNGAVQEYNAFTAALEHNLRNGLSFRTGWTWAKSLTNSDETGDVEGGPLIENSYNLQRNYGNSEYSPRHRVVISGLYELPFGYGKPFLHQNSVFSRLIGGFQMSASYIVQTGLYYTPTWSGKDISNTNQTSGRPDRVGNWKVDHPTIKQWFNPKAFAVPQPGTFGNAAYGSIEGPGTQGLNVALFKAFTIKGENRLRLQVSATNALNHPNFAGPTLNITTAGAGAITSTQTTSFSGPRNVLLGVRYNF